MLKRFYSIAVFFLVIIFLSGCYTLGYRFDDKCLYDGSGDEIVDTGEDDGNNLTNVHGKTATDKNNGLFPTVAAAVYCNGLNLNSTQEQYGIIADHDQLSPLSIAPSWLSSSKTTIGVIFQTGQLANNPLLSKNNEYKMEIRAQHLDFTLAGGVSHTISTSASLVTDVFYLAYIYYKNVRSGQDTITLYLYEWDGTANWVAVEAKTENVSGSISQTTNDLFFGKEGNQYFSGIIDQVFISDTQLSFADIIDNSDEPSGCASCVGVDHYEILHDGHGLTCEPESILVKVCATADCSTLYTGTVSITLSPTGWVEGETQTLIEQELYHLRHTIAENIELGISSPNPAAPIICFDSSDSSADCTMTFHDAGFVFDVPTQVACKTSNPITIKAVRKDDSQQCVPAFANRSVDINFGLTYVSPGSGTQAVTVENTSVTASSVTAVSLEFNVVGEAIFTVSYPDAGNIQLDGSFVGTGSEVGLEMVGSDSFVVHPVGLCVYSDDPHADCLAGDSSCSAFTVAGLPFNLKVKGVCWEIDGENNTDFCTGNVTTPNFELAGIDITQTLIAPAGGVTGALGVASFDMAPADDGEHLISNQTVSEVGVFSFTADSPDYLGSGDLIPISTSSYIGRFTPDHFKIDAAQVTNGVLQPACGGSFTYTGQEMGYSTQPSFVITALNGAVAPETTANYTGSFNNLTIAGIDLIAPGQDNASLGSDGVTLLQISTSLNDGVLTDNNDGSSAYTFSVADSFTYDRDNNATVAPFTPNFSITINNVTDSDGVTATVPSPLPSIIPDGSGVAVRYGRLKVFNNFGPETADITNSPFIAQYYTGTEWLTNTIDHCSTGLLFCSVPVAGRVTDIQSIISGRGTFTVTSSGISDEVLDICPIAPGWLTDLPDCTTVDNSCGEITFGIYRGNDRIINWREIIR